jgi:hypothetical protein
MNKLFISILIAVSSGLFAQEAGVYVPQIAVLNVVSGAYKDGQTRLFTDILRSQLFKTEIFRVIEPGVIQQTIQEKNVQLTDENHDSQFLNLGKSLAVDKILITNIETFGDSIALNSRIVDVETSTIDFTDIIFVDHEDQIRESLNEMVLKIDIHFRGKESPTVQDLVNAKPLSEEQKREALWRRMGATGDTLGFLTEYKIDPDEYLFLRQYDINFGPVDYADFILGGMDIQMVKNFLQAGIPFQLAKEAIQLGITKLDQYRNFSNQGYDFQDFLTAYKNGIIEPEQYTLFRDGFKQDFLNIGIGGVADSWPVMNADYKFLLGNISLEHFFNANQRDWFRASIESGAMLMQFFGPIPYASLNAYLSGGGPFYFKMGVGGFYDAIFGGHGGIMTSVGIEFRRSLEIDLFMVPWGNQPNVSYVDFETKLGEAGYEGINFPYAGIMIKYKLPVDLYRYDRDQLQ